MPTFELSTPDGATYQIDAPDERAAVQALGQVHQLPGQDPQKQEHISQPSSLDTAATALGGFIEGIPVVGPLIRGGTERAAAGTLSLMSGKPYDEVLKLVQDDKQRMKEEHPILDTTSQIAGAIGSTIPVAATATGAKALGIVGGNLAERAGAGAASGVAIGGADALVRSGGDLGEAAKGAGVGGMIGGAVPIIGAGIGAGVRAAKAAASPAMQAIGNRIRPQGQAADLAARAFQRDSISLDDAAQRLAAMRKTNPDAVLTDIGGANVRGVARAAANTPGPQKEAIQSFMEARNLAQPQRITELVRSVLKNPDDFTKTASRLAAERERIASPIYEQAFGKSAPVNVNGVVKYIDEKVLPGVSSLADPLSDLRPDGLTATLSKLRSFFATSRNQRFDLRQLHQIKQELDGMIGTAKRAGDDGKARAILGVQNRLLQAMDQASPLYKKARGIYSNSFEMEDALDLGRNILRMRPEEVTAAAESLTPAGRELMQVGMARAIADVAQSTRDGRDLTKVIFGTPQVRASIKAAFPNAQDFRKFTLALNREGAMRKTADAIRGNSTTAAQLADLMDVNTGGIGRDAFSQLLEGRPIQATATAIRQVLQGEKGINEKVAQQLGDMLLSTDPGQIQKAITILSRKQGALERIQRRINAISTTGTAATGQALQVPHRSSLSSD